MTRTSKECHCKFARPINKIAIKMKWPWEKKKRKKSMEVFSKFFKNASYC